MIAAAAESGAHLGDVVWVVNPTKGTRCWCGMALRLADGARANALRQLYLSAARPSALKAYLSCHKFPLPRNPVLPPLYDNPPTHPGTPTPATSGSSAAHLQPLLAFLRHVPYGTNACAWQAAVQRPLEGCRPEGRRRLMRLLRDTMVRWVRGCMCISS